LVQMKKNDYMYGTSAEKIRDEIYETNKVLKEKRKYRLNRAAKTKMFFSILFLFVLGFLVAYRYALITDLNFSLCRLQTQYEKLRSENSRLKIAIEKDTDLSKIKNIAETKLNMQKPDKYQVVYIRVPKSNFTVISNDYKNNTKNNANKNDLFAVILNKADIIRKLLD
jgi:cell division protein FtsL